MYNVLKKHSRKLLAVATAMLMIAFLLPTRQNQRNDYVYGKISGKKVYASQMNQAQYHWHLLMSRIFDKETQRPVALSYLPEQVVQQMEEHPELFMLLETEAHNNGVYISDDRLMELRTRIIANEMDTRDRGAQDSVNDALRGLLAVRESFERVASAVRVSQPLRDHEIATRLQQIKMRGVAFSAADYMDKVPAPTADEVKQQFDKYKDIDASNLRPSKDNPFAFGYRFPDRAQVQYLMVPEEQVRKAVEASQSQKEWSKEAAKYYLQHQAQFVSTTQPAADPLSLQKAKPVATTRPFEEVEKEALEAVMQPLVTKRQQDIISRINAIIATDWNTYHSAKQGEQAASSLGVPYNSYEYLQKLNETIAKEFKVQLTIGASGGLLSANELFALEPIGRSFTQTQLPFSFYATMTDTQRKQLLSRVPNIPAALQPWQPSQVLRNYSGDAFIFRRTIIDPTHTPQNLQEVAAQVEKDVKLVKAFEMAKAAAEQFNKEAAAQGFDAASLAAHKAPVELGYISLGGTPTTGIQFSENGSAQFAEAALTQALKERAGGQEKPVVVAPVQKDGKVVVAQVGEIRSRLQGVSLPLVAAEIDNQLQSQFAALMLTDWFKYDNVAKRVQYEPADTRKQQKQSDDQGETPAAPAQQPLGI